MTIRESIGRRVSSIPLRIGLVVVLVSMSGFALVVSGTAVTSSLSRTLIGRIDEQLVDATHGWATPRSMKQVTTEDGREAWIPEQAAPPQTWPPSVDQPRRYYEKRTGPQGQVYVEFDAETGDSVVRPDVRGVPASEPTTVGSLNGASLRWRVLSITNEFGTTTVAMPLNEIRDTVSWLVAFEAITGCIVLTALGTAGYFIVRRSLRPLRQVEETAAAIAGGDLSQRVPVRGVETEVDHLAQSLNSMLARIQQGIAVTEASEEAARRSETRMRQFVADASHELRTPLTTIRGFAELYRQGALTEADLVLKRIEAEAGRMGLLVEDLLMLAHLDAKRPLERAPVDLLTLAGDAVHNARAIDARQRGTDGPARPIGLQILPGTGTLEVNGDEARLRQVLANLIGNALAHTPPGTPIAVRLTPGSRDVRIDVADEGPGLAPQDAARVFERFYRTDSSRTRASGGSGLGLSIVNALVVAHGGTVGVESVPGLGATFSVVLPREAAVTRPEVTAGSSMLE